MSKNSDRPSNDLPSMLNVHRNIVSVVNREQICDGVRGSGLLIFSPMQKICFFWIKLLKLQ